jgi:hypothetical protein
MSAARSSLPEIRLITAYPVLLPDGRISPPGYDPDSRTYYAGPMVSPETDLEAIREHLLDLITDFPFEDQASRANFLGLLLTPMVRPLVGKTPLHLVTSPQPGTGKSRLVEEVMGITYLGEALPSSALPERAEERAKWLTALLLSGDPIVHLDNLTDQLDSAHLASLVTSAKASDRRLGASEFIRLDNNLTIAATGNNTQLSAEMARRSVIVRLYWRGPGLPDARTNYTHPDIASHTLLARDHTLSCLAGACAAWVAAGSPHGPEAIGSFESWSRTVGGILRVLGIADHLGSRSRWREESDSETSDHAALVMAWATTYGEQPVSATELSTLPEWLAIMKGPAQAGRLLAKLRDRTLQLADEWQATVARDGWTATRRPAYRLVFAGSYPRIACKTILPAKTQAIDITWT